MPNEPLSLKMVSWNSMQKPKHKGRAVCDSFWSLMAAIDQDWHVMEPVLKVNRNPSGHWSYMFFLDHRDHPQLCEIILPDCADVTKLIRSNGYLIETNL